MDRTPHLSFCRPYNHFIFNSLTRAPPVRSILEVGIHRTASGAQKIVLSPFISLRRFPGILRLRRKCCFRNKMRRICGQAYPLPPFGCSLAFIACVGWLNKIS